VAVAVDKAVAVAVELAAAAMAEQESSSFAIQTHSQILHPSAEHLFIHIQILADLRFINLQQEQER
jgi:hypothetical protein